MMMIMITVTSNIMKYVCISCSEDKEGREHHSPFLSWVIRLVLSDSPRIQNGSNPDAVHPNLTSLKSLAVTLPIAYSS